MLSGSAQTVRMSDLPLSRILFLPDGSVVGAGHCYDPILFARTSAGWKCAGKLSGAKKEAEKVGNFASAKNMFQAQTTTGQTNAIAKLTSVHQNQVRGLQAFGASLGAVHAEFTTSALDGKIVFWTRDEITSAMAALAL